MTDQENNLVGCVNADGSKLCANLPSITWRFVTAMAKGEPHHWTSMGGDAQKGALKVMFDGPRIDHTYDPMRKQGAILLGNGGDNSVGSQGTFYEGAMTAAGTFPTRRDRPAGAGQRCGGQVRRAAAEPSPRRPPRPTPPGLQTFSPGSSQDTTVTFTNTIGSARDGRHVEPRRAHGVDRRRRGHAETSETIAGPVAPGASVSATFKVTSGSAAFNGDLVGTASWKNATSGVTQSETTVREGAERQPDQDQRVPRQRRLPPTRQTRSSSSTTPAPSAVDISNWTLTEHQTQQAIFSSVKIPAGTKLAAGGFYLLGLSNSGLAVPAKKGDTTIYVRSTAGMNVGDTITIDTGAGMETRKIASLGTAAGIPRRCGSRSPTVR